MFDLLSNPFQLKKIVRVAQYNVFRIFLRYNYNIRNPSKLSIKEKKHAHTPILWSIKSMDTPEIQ